jgi:hypothetical protein
MRDFMLPPQCIPDLRSSGMLRSVGRYSLLLTFRECVSIPSFKGQDVQDISTLEKQDFHF